jgi:hypothetical protein
MAYQILKTNGNLLTTIPDGTISQAYSTLQLPGRNYNGYGQFLDTNFVHLLENFSSANAPLNSLTGQLWFNPSSNTLSVAITDGGPGFTSTWTSVVTTSGDVNNPIFNGNLTANGWFYTTGNARFDGPVTITNNSNSTSTVTGSFTTVGGVGIGGNLYVGGTIVGTLSGNVTGNLITGGSNNAVVITNANSVAVGASYLSYTESTEANLQVEGNLIVVPPSLSGPRFSVGSNANLGTTQMNVAFANGSSFSVQANTMAFTGPGTFSVSTGANPITLTTTSSNVVVQGQIAANSVANGSMVITVGGNPALSLGPNIYSNGSMFAKGAMVVGADVTNSGGSGTTNASAVLTVYGTSAANSTTTSGALNVQGGARVIGNLVVGTGNSTDYAFIFNTDNVNAQSTSFATGTLGNGALQVQGGIGAAGNIYAYNTLSGNAVILRNGLVWLDTTGENRIERTGSGASAVTTLVVGNTSPAIFANTSAANAANFQFGITTPILTTGSNATSGTITGNWTLSTGSKLNATYADLAERFESDYPYEAGTVVELGGEKEITAVRQDLSEDVFGVISNTAGYLMNAGAGDDATHPPVAVSGRVQVNVLGKVKKGERLVSAGGGFARAAKHGEATHFTTLGRALENKTTDGVGRVLAVVNAKLS